MTELERFMFLFITVIYSLNVKEKNDPLKSYYNYKVITRKLTNKFVLFLTKPG